MSRLGLVVAVMVMAAIGPDAALANPAPDPDWLRRIESGEVAFEAHPDPGGRGGWVRAMIDIAAPPEAVWRTILDCDRAARMTPSVKRCTVLSRDASGRT